MRAFIKLIFIYLVISATLLSGCAQKTGTFFYGSLGLGDTRIIVVSYVANVANVVSMYNEAGEFIDILANYGKEAFIPRGVALKDPITLLYALDTPDRIDVGSILTGGAASFTSNAQFTGNVFDVETGLDGSIFVVESNAIEKFNSTGDRVGNGATAYISALLGACPALNTPHGLTLLPNGNLVVVNSGGTDNITIYGVSTNTATCVGTSAIGNDPWDVAYSPLGYLVVGSQATDAIYKINTDLTGLTLLYSTGSGTYNPNAIAVLPNGNILLAGVGNDAIDLIGPGGSAIQTNWIKNAMTNDVQDILVITGY